MWKHSARCSSHGTSLVWWNYSKAWEAPRPALPEACRVTELPHDRMRHTPALGPNLFAAHWKYAAPAIGLYAPRRKPPACWQN